MEHELIGFVDKVLVAPRMLGLWELVKIGTDKVLKAPRVLHWVVGWGYSSVHSTKSQRANVAR